MISFLRNEFNIIQKKKKNFKLLDSQIVLTYKKTIY